MDSVIPNWVADALLRRKLPVSKDAQKFCFVLIPYDEKDMGKLPIGSKLFAHRLIKVSKIIHYVVNKLDLKLPKKEGEDTTIPPEEFLEIVCNNQVLSIDASLATVKVFIWKSGEDMNLQYRHTEKYISEKLKNTKKKM